LYRNTIAVTDRPEACKSGLMLIRCRSLEPESRIPLSPLNPYRPRRFSLLPFAVIARCVERPEQTFAYKFLFETGNKKCDIMLEQL
jgi:hypothetical protein